MAEPLTSQAYAVAVEQVDMWKACGLSNEEMFAAITGADAHCVSEGVVIAVIAAAWIDMQRAHETELRRVA